MKKTSIRIGAINWDAALPKDTYFGGYTIRNLGNEKYKSRLPYFATEQDGKFDIPYRTQADYDKELMYAIEGGIDFFAYCWYPDSNCDRTIWHDDKQYEFLVQHYPELNTARKLYQSSKLNSKINMCAIMFSINAYSQSDFDALTDAMQQDYYEKIDGRPLVIIFGGYQGEFIRIIREYAAKKGLNPYVAFVNNSGRGDYTLDYSEADAVTAYGTSHSANTFDELIERCNEDNNNKLNYNMPVIPMMTMGWNPSPRVDSPSPWVSYEDAAYAGQPDIDCIQKSFCTLCEFIQSNSQRANTNHALVFAWNEFEEGGYLCPTLNDDGTCDDSFIKSFYQVRKNY